MDAPAGTGTSLHYLRAIVSNSRDRTSPVGSQRTCSRRHRYSFTAGRQAAGSNPGPNIISEPISFLDDAAKQFLFRKSCHILLGLTGTRTRDPETGSRMTCQSSHSTPNFVSKILIYLFYILKIVNPFFVDIYHYFLKNFLHCNFLSYTSLPGSVGRASVS